LRKKGGLKREKGGSSLTRREGNEKNWDLKGGGEAIAKRSQERKKGLIWK